MVSARLGRRGWRRAGPKTRAVFAALRPLRPVLITAVTLACCTVVLLSLAAAAAEPAVSAAPEAISGDPRSDGVGPGLVGSPLLVLGAVVLLGVATALVTALFLRLSRRG